MDHRRANLTQIIFDIGDPSEPEHDSMVQDTVMLGTTASPLTSVTSEPGPPSLHLLLAIMLGPLALVFLVSFVIHWYQVIQRIQRERTTKDAMNGNIPQHTPAARMMSIRTLENQRSGDCLMVYPSNSNNPIIYTSVPTITKEEFKVSRDVY